MIKKIYYQTSKLFSPKYFLKFSHQSKNIFGFSALFLISIGIGLALWMVPADYRQNDMYRILYIHVPAAWLSLMIYSLMTILSIMYYVWNIRVANILLYSSAPIGALFTFLTLLTGSIWGKPAWGSFWHWDVRITSEFILLLIYLGYMTIHYALPNDQNRSKIGAIFIMIGAINLPIIKFSVQWWSSLHQPASINLLKGSIHFSEQMLFTLLIMWIGYLCYYVWCVLCLTRNMLLHDRNIS